VLWRAYYSVFNVLVVSLHFGELQTRPALVGRMVSRAGSVTRLTPLFLFLGVVSCYFVPPTFWKNRTIVVKTYMLGGRAMTTAHH
jgi:hypothetical protein